MLIWSHFTFLTCDFQLLNRKNILSYRLFEKLVVDAWKQTFLLKKLSKHFVWNYKVLTFCVLLNNFLLLLHVLILLKDVAF